MPAADLLIWNESYWVGGSDRFMVDLLQGLDRSLTVRIAGNPLPELDAWLAERVPWALPRRTIRVANLVDSPLARLRRRVVPTAPALAEEAPEAPTATVLGVGTAALRYRAAAVNHVRLRRLLARERPRALLINNGGYPGAESCRVAAPAARAAGVGRVVQFVHNMAYPPAWPVRAELAYDARVDAALDTWLTAADRASDALAQRRGIARGHVRTLHYGIPDPAPAPPGFDRAAVRAELGFADGDLGVVVPAAFERRKGHLVLLDALARAPRAVRVALVGTGEEEAAVRTRAAELGLGERVRFLGWRDDVDRLLRAGDAMALPSLANECLPYAIMEAMAHALPVVGTDVAGIPEEVEDGRTGFVVPPGDAAALAAALAALEGDRARAAAMGAAGAERRARLFTRDRMVRDLAAVLGLGGG